MTRLFEIDGYIVYFWSNENGEHVHVHVSKKQQVNATKIWLTSNGGVSLEHNKSRIPKRDLNKIMQAIILQHKIIVNFWYNYHRYLTYKQ